MIQLNVNVPSHDLVLEKRTKKAPMGIQTSIFVKNSFVKEVSVLYVL